MSTTPVIELPVSVFPVAAKGQAPDKVAALQEAG
jgi:hypothetical protein